jgi:hypothetical protein
MPRKLRVEYPGVVYHQPWPSLRLDWCDGPWGSVRKHLNPARAGILKAEERLLAYRLL